MTFLRVKNWEKFQHYKDRRPIWIKSYIERLDDYEYVQLKPVERLVYNELLLLAAKTENAIPNDSEWIAKQIHLDTKDVQQALATLSEHGFLKGFQRKRSASKRLAKPELNDIPEVEEQTENKDPAADFELPLAAAVRFHPILGAGRDEAMQHLLARVRGGDEGTPRVIHGFCKQLPSERIDRVTKTLRFGVPPGVAVSALKREVKAFQAEVAA